MSDRAPVFDRDQGVLLAPGLRRSNYVYLFFGLSLLLVVGPALDELLPRAGSSFISAGCLMGALLIGIWSLSNSKLVFRTGLLLSILAAGFLGIEIVSGSRELRIYTLLTFMAFLVLSVYHASRDVAFGSSINVNRLVGALCIYEMLGLIWAILFAVIVHISPTAFPVTALNTESTFWDFVYYSFVTLTTLGYGDVAPSGGTTKALAYMEALVGQLYLAVTIASLVGTHLEHTRRPDA